jgi:hypothetical protein
MDPYLEAQPDWGDLHATMISVMKAELNRRVPKGYSVWSDVYIWLHEPDAETRRGKPTATILPAVRREGNKYLV